MRLDSHFWDGVIAALCFAGVWAIIILKLAGIL